MMSPIKPLIVIGLVGPSGSGKTTICEHMEQEYGFTTIHVAMPLKMAYCKMFRAPLTHTERPMVDVPQDYLGGVTPRVVLENLGTELHRVAPMALPLQLKSSLAALQRMGSGYRILVDGIRRQTEADVVWQHAGRVWRAGVDTPIDLKKPCDVSQATIQCDANFSWVPKHEQKVRLDAEFAKLLGDPSVGHRC